MSANLCIEKGDVSPNLIRGWNSFVRKQGLVHKGEKGVFPSKSVMNYEYETLSSMLDLHCLFCMQRE